MSPRSATDPGGSRNTPRPKRVEEDEFKETKAAYDRTYPKRTPFRLPRSLMRKIKQ